MNKEDVIQNKNEAIKMMTDYLDNCLAIDDNSNIKKVKLISYWQKDYINYIKDENNFNPTKQKTYRKASFLMLYKSEFYADIMQSVYTSVYF